MEEVPCGTPSRAIVLPDYDCFGRLGSHDTFLIAFVNPVAFQFAVPKMMAVADAVAPAFKT